MNTNTSAPTPASGPTPDAGCICHGNWRQIMAESRPLIGKEFVDSHGGRFVFFGVVDGEDDYYYGMWSRQKRRLALLSCVGSIEGHGYTLGDRHQDPPENRLAMGNNELDHIVRKARDAKNGGFGVLSTGEKLAVALVLNRPDWLAEMNYTLAEAIDRVGPQWMALIPEAARLLEDEG